MSFALTFRSSGHQSALSNNEIICWKDVHFEDHSLPVLVIYMDLKEDLKSFSPLLLR